MSISVADRQIVEEVVEEFKSKGWQFTAYNITTEAKKRGAGDRHLNLKKAVHDMFRQGDLDSYTRDLVDIKSVGSKAYLYSPSGSDVSDYDEDEDQADADGDADGDMSIADGLDIPTSNVVVD
jgi:hypothetical protein